MPEQQHPLERRREMLTNTLLYVEDQRQKGFSRETADVVAWARHELMFVEALLRQHRLLEQFQAYRSPPSRALAA